MALLALLGLIGCAEPRATRLGEPSDTFADALAAALTPGEDAGQRAPQAAETVRITPGTTDQRAARGFILTPAAGAAAPSGPGTPPPDLAETQITLDFKGADLASVVQVMMEDGLGARYVLDPAVSGVVTLHSNRPLRRAEILPTLEEILRLNEAALIERDGLYRIVPRAQAGLTAPVITATSAAQRGLTMRVTPLRHVTVADVSDVLDGFSPVAGAIRYDRSRNLVFTIADSAEQATLLDVIAALDNDYFAERGFALRPLANADPAPVVDELTQLFASPSGAPSPAIRFISVERMNAVMVVAEEEQLLHDAVDLIKRLDQGVAQKPRLHVFPVANRRADDLARLLGDLFGVGAQGAAPGSSALAPGLTPVTIGGASLGGGAETAAADLGAGDAAARAVEAGDGGSSGGAAGPSGPSAEGVIRIVADEASNAVVAYATADGAQAVARALKRLDVQPLQVMLEATLLEVTLNDQLEYGVRWFFEEGNFSANFTDLASAATPGLQDLAPGFNAAFRTTSAAATVSALDEVTDVRVLSSPTLMVLDSQTARLQVGDQVPVTTRSSQSTADPDAPLVTEEEFRDTGVILEIRPTVNASGLVTLEVRQEVSDVLATAGSANPTFAQRVVQSTIAVQSGETIALAGLIEEEAEFERAGLPVLSRLPVLGSAFGATDQTASRSELIVLVRPIVVRDQGEARAATAELSAKLTGLRNERAAEGQD